MQKKFGTKRIYSRKIRLLLFGVVMMSGLFGCSKNEEYVTVMDTQATEVSVANDGYGADASATQQEEISQVTEETQELTYIYVDICGAVNYPGVYRLKPEARVFEVVELAGGFTKDAGEVAINRAEYVEDGQKIYVPTKEEWESGLWMDAESAYVSDGNQNDGRININTADVAVLCTLPGIGETRANAIVQYREEHGGFTAVEDIQKVSGIKNGTYEKIKEFIKVQ